MAFIKSISGFRGTIGGPPGENLTPPDIVDCTAGFAAWLLESGRPPLVVLGRDARVSGEMVHHLVLGTLQACGINVIDLGLSTTPTLSLAIPYHQAGGGIMITASHNPGQWNALKFMDESGEFVAPEYAAIILQKVADHDFHFVPAVQLGRSQADPEAISRHIQALLDLDLVNPDAIRSRQFTVAVDCINSTGAISVIPLLETLGCRVHPLFDDMSGHFAHNPEPLPEHVGEICQWVKDHQCDLGIVVDPDVDRLAFIMPDGRMFGEEYTLVAAALAVLRKRPGNTVSNLSSTRALRDLTLQYQGRYFPSAVGEVNVVRTMKDHGAVIGGEGNGGVILPDLHYGRDALAGIALVLTYLAEENLDLKQVKEMLPAYEMAKDKIELDDPRLVDPVLDAIEQAYRQFPLNKTDGIRIDMESGWVHIRRSNTEPIIRVYAEGGTAEQARQLAQEVKSLALAAQQRSKTTQHHPAI